MHLYLQKFMAAEPLSNPSAEILQCRINRMAVSLRFHSWTSSLQDVALKNRRDGKKEKN